MRQPKESDFEKMREKWAPLVGRFILEFGEIENVTYFALLQLPKDQIFSTTSTLPFGKRVDLVRELVSGNEKIPKDLGTQFEEELKAAKKLAEMRNIVAHSPLLMKIYEHPKEGWTYREEAIGTLKHKENSISFEQLSEAGEEAGALAIQLKDTYTNIYKVLFDGKDA